MEPTAADWDARVERLTGRLPVRVRDAVTWLRRPSRRPARLVAALALIGGGVLSFLPVLGLWMLPLGLALLSEDIPALKPRLEALARAIKRAVSRLRKP
ncbi:MAG: hypothetical protein INR70_01845 [Parafilimonas terrae]|nr:hypothetical protein [Parafilimonas terrae]